MFNRMDENKDGFVSLDEFKKAHDGMCAAEEGQVTNTECVQAQFKSRRPDFFQKEALRRERRRAFSLWGRELWLADRVQIAQHHRSMVQIN